MLIRCRDGSVIRLHLLHEDDGFYVAKEKEGSVRIICGISATTGKAIIYDKYGDVTAYGIPEVLKKYPRTHYNNCHSVEVATPVGTYLYCCFYENEFHIGLTTDQDYWELLVVDELNVSADFIPHE